MNNFYLSPVFQSQMDGNLKYESVSTNDLMAMREKIKEQENIIRDLRKKIDLYKNCMIIQIPKQNMYGESSEMLEPIEKID